MEDLYFLFFQILYFHSLDLLMHEVTSTYMYLIILEFIT